MAAEWEFRVCLRDLTRIGSFCITEDIDELVSGLGFDPGTVSDDLDAITLKESKNDVSSGTATLPLDSPANDWMIEDRLLLLYVRGTFVTGALIGVADDDLLLDEKQRGRFAAYGITHLNDLLSEPIVYNLPGVGLLPPGDDRNLDSSDPHYDASAWDTPDELMTITAAQLSWILTPFANGFGGDTSTGETPAGDLAQAVGPPGFTADPDPPPQNGVRYLRSPATVEDGAVSIPGGSYRGFVVGDDNYGPPRIDGTNVIDQQITQFGNASTFDLELTEGIHIFWMPLRQSEDPDNPGSGLGPTAGGFALCPRLQNDQVGTPVIVSDSTWKIWDDTSTTPGFNLGQMAAVLLFEAVARGAALEIVQDFDGTNDSDGNPWPGVVIRSTKAGTSLATFFGKELGEDSCDYRMTVVDEALTWRLWPKGRDTSVDVELVPGENIGGLTINRARTEVTAALCRAHDRFYEVAIEPAAGHPRKEKLLQVGAAQTEAEVIGIATPQLDLFGRIREKLSITHVTGRQTPNAEMPGLAYWVLSKFLVPVARDFSTGEVEVISETVTKLDSGQLAFTAEFGDVVVPPEGRPGLALSKLAPGLRSRTSSRPS